MQRNPELERAILADFDDPRPWAVYADWLQAQGDPWGERLSLELARASAKKINEQRNIEKRLAALDRQHRVAMLGTELARVIDHEEFEDVASVEWRHGFVAGLGVRAVYDYSLTPAEVLQALLASPAACFLQRLSMGITDERYPASLESGIRALSEAPQLDTLRELLLGDFNYPEESEISWVRVGNVVPVLQRCPDLRSLHLCGAEIELGDALIHPRLERLKIETGGLPARAVQAVGRAWLPELRTLEVWLGQDGYGGDGDIEMLAPLFGGQGVPKLESLALVNSEFEDDIAIALAKAPILDRLKRVGLSMGVLRDRGAQAILAAADRFRHLEAIDLDFNWLSSGMAERLQAALPSVHIGRRNEPRVPEPDDTEEDEDDYGHYYTQVGE